jgi:molybdopterin converting factor small subunit
MIPISQTPNKLTEQLATSMNVRVKLFGVFRSAAGTNEVELQIREPHPTVKSVVSELVSQESYAGLRQLLLSSDSPDPRPNALIMVSGREINTLNGLETTLTENDELSLLPVSHGG